MVSIILPCYNAENHLESCLRSLLGQDYSNIEIIAIDDGSKDGTTDILTRFAQVDKRIIVFRNEENQGIARALNQGVKRATGKWIARMDADDIAHPERIKKQVKFLEQHPDIDILGTKVHLIDGKGEILFPNTFVPQCPKASFFISFFTAPVYHPTVMAKTSIFKENPYSEQSAHQYIEDLELWHRLAVQGKRISNLQESLLKYRSHSGSTSGKRAKAQQEKLISFVQAVVQEQLGLATRLPQVEEILYKGQSNLKPGKIDKAIFHFDNLLKDFLKKFGTDPTAEKEMKTFIAIYLASLLRKEVAGSHISDIQTLLKDFILAFNYSGETLAYFFKTAYHYLKRMP